MSSQDQKLDSETLENQGPQEPERATRTKSREAFRPPGSLAISQNRLKRAAKWFPIQGRDERDTVEDGVPALPAAGAALTAVAGWGGLPPPLGQQCNDVGTISIRLQSQEMASCFPEPPSGDR
jgi:hypothetical protein